MFARLCAPKPAAISEIHITGGPKRRAQSQANHLWSRLAESHGGKISKMGSSMAIESGIMLNKNGSLRCEIEHFAGSIYL